REEVEEQSEFEAKQDRPRDGSEQVGAEPAAEEERHAEARERDQVDVLGHREEAEAHTAVLGVVARDELLLGLRQVEGRTGGLRSSGKEEDEEPDELGNRLPDR